ncbi:MAG TPA: hypothetical protein VN887_04380 [Candidatus Angelobacter sp.]|nr:hypothetical protein [Candidatus Angelobacter sp.]
MSTEYSNENDARLGRLLNEWKPDAVLPPRFQEGVWRRIAQGDDSTRDWRWTDLLQPIEACFRRPALAVAYVAVLLMVGIGAGLLQAREKASQIDHGLQARYLQAVDPYQKTR